MFHPHPVFHPVFHRDGTEFLSEFRRVPSFHPRARMRIRGVGCGAANLAADSRKTCFWMERWNSVVIAEQFCSVLTAQRTAHHGGWNILGSAL